MNTVWAAMGVLRIFKRYTVSIFNNRVSKIDFGHLRTTDTVPIDLHLQYLSRSQQPSPSSFKTLSDDTKGNIFYYLSNLGAGAVGVGLAVALRYRRRRMELLDAHNSSDG